MNSKLNGEGVIENSNNLQKRELPHLSIWISFRKPTLKDTLFQQIPNPLHGHLSLLLHGLVIVRRDKHFVSTLFGIEKPTLDHKAKEPITIRDIVRVEVYAHVGGVEREWLVEVRRRVVEARVGGERWSS